MLSRYPKTNGIGYRHCRPLRAEAPCLWKCSPLQRRRRQGIPAFQPREYPRASGTFAPRHRGATETRAPEKRKPPIRTRRAAFRALTSLKRARAFGILVSGEGGFPAEKPDSAPKERRVSHLGDASSGTLAHLPQVEAVAFSASFLRRHWASFLVRRRFCFLRTSGSCGVDMAATIHPVRPRRKRRNTHLLDFSLAMVGPHPCGELPRGGGATPLAKVRFMLWSHASILGRAGPSQTILAKRCRRWGVWSPQTPRSP